MMLGSVLLLLVLALLSVYLLCVHGGRKRKDGEPPLIKGLIPVLGKAVEFGRDTLHFLTELKNKHGDVFTVQIAGKYMTFIMNPLLFPAIIKHGRQLDFHEFSDQVAPPTFGYPPVGGGRFPGMQEHILRSQRLLQGEGLTALTQSMMANLMTIFRQDHLGGAEPGGAPPTGWRRSSLYEFCSRVMFEATFLTLYGRPVDAQRHSGMGALRSDFVKFDNVFPLLIARVPIWMMWGTKAVREKLIRYFLPDRMIGWSNTSQFIRRRSEIFQQYDKDMTDVDKAAHHFAILWAAVGNTVPATFWTLYYLLAHPEALRVVRREVLDVLQLSETEDITHRDISLTREQLERLPYMDSSINESLRLSSSSMNIRVVQEDFSLTLEAERPPVAVRKGDVIALYPQSMHMDPDIYQDPEEFRYDRFLEAGGEKTDFFKEGQRLKYYRMPFGSGSSMCPGRHFAVNEIKQFLALTLLYFDLQLLQGQAKVALDYSRAGLGILMPTNDVQVRYRQRSALLDETDKLQAAQRPIGRD